MDTGLHWSEQRRMIDWWPGACDPQPDWKNPEIKGIAASEAELTGDSRAPLQMSLDLLNLILIWFNSEGDGGPREIHQYSYQYREIWRKYFRLFYADIYCMCDTCIEYILMTSNETFNFPDICEKFMKIHSKKLKCKKCAIFDWCELHFEAKQAPF